MVQKYQKGKGHITTTVRCTERSGPSGMAEAVFSSAKAMVVLSGGVPKLSACPAPSPTRPAWFATKTRALPTFPTDCSKALVVTACRRSRKQLVTRRVSRCEDSWLPTNADRFYGRFDMIPGRFDTQVERANVRKTTQSAVSMDVPTVAEKAKVTESI